MACSLGPSAMWPICTVVLLVIDTHACLKDILGKRFRILENKNMLKPNEK